VSVLPEVDYLKVAAACVEVGEQAGMSVGMAA
jgi:hypothetical protein